MINEIISEVPKREYIFCSHAFETTKQPMAISDRSTRTYQYANQAFLDYFGYSKDEIVGNSYNNIDFYHNLKDKEEINKSLEIHGYVDEYPIVLNTKSKDKKYAVLTINIFNIDDKEYTYTILDDKTEIYNTNNQYLEMEKENQAILESFNSVLESTYHHIWIVDPYRHSLLKYNGAYEDYFKKKGIDLIPGMTVEEIMINDKNADFWHELYIRAIKDGKLTLDYKTEIGDLWLTVTIAPIRINGNLIGISGFAEDITERMKYKIDLEKSNSKLNLLFDQAIQAISKIGELKDSYTAGHQKRVQELSIAISRDMGLENEIIDNIALGALIHDIGKIFIPSDILNKPGKISEYELKILQEHSKHAFEIVSYMDLPEIIPKMIIQHHEKLDGSGYPYRLKGDEICLEARIIAVADVVEAMNSHRPYRSALGIDAALEEIEKYRGIRYDSAVVDTCLELFREKGFEFVNE